MLQGISPLLSPVLISVLCEMGHGDEILFADAHYPGSSLAKRLVRADGLTVDALLGGVLPLFPLDTYVESPVTMMAAVPGDDLDPAVEKRYRLEIDKVYPGTPAIARVERFAFYERSKDAFAVVMTGETCKYGNVFLRKGLVSSTI